MSLVGSANLGPLSVSKEVPVTENGKSVVAERGSTSGSLSKEVAMPKIVEGLKPQLKGGASASVDFSGKVTSAAVANVVGKVEKAAEAVKQIVRQIVPPRPMENGF
jgi:hypothetical protein